MTMYVKIHINNTTLRITTQLHNALRKQSYVKNGSCNHDSGKGCTLEKKKGEATV